MNITPFPASSRHLSAGVFVFGAFVFGAVSALAPTSSARADGFGDRANRCARYGADFVAIAGSDACVRLGGHVRVGIARAPAGAPMGYAPQQDGVRRASETSHVRGGEGLGIIELFPR